MYLLKNGAGILIPMVAADGQTNQPLRLAHNGQILAPGDDKDTRS